MIDRQRMVGTGFDDDGSGRLAIIGVLLVLAVVAGGVALNLGV